MAPGATANPARLHCSETFRRAARLNEGHVFPWIKSKAGKSVARDKICGAAEARDCDRSAFELLRRLDFGLRHQLIVQAHYSADDVDGIGSCQSGANDAGTGSLYQRSISRNHRSHRHRPAGKIDGLSVEIVLREDSGILGDPNDQLIGADAAIADGDSGQLRGCGSG